MVRPGQLGTPDAGALTWRQFGNERLTLYAWEGSYAAKRAAAELRAAERIIAQLEELLQPAAEARNRPVAIYLTDPAEPPDSKETPRVDDGPAAGMAEPDPGVIIRIVEPDAPGQPLAYSLTRLLIPRWTGANAGEATLFVDGIAGVVAARTETGPPVEEAADWVREELNEGRTVSIFARLAETGVPGSESEAAAGTTRAATAFVSYLIDAFGAESLRRFLAAYDPQRRDHAAISVYQRALGALEESWVESLRERTGTGEAFRSFFHHVGPLIRPFRWRLVEVFVYMVVGLTYSLALPLGGKYIVDSIIPRGDVRGLIALSLGLLVLYLLNALIGLRRVYVNNWINQNILLGLQERMFAALQYLPHGFYAKAKIGDLMSRLSNDVEVVQQAMSQVLGVGVFLALRAITAAIAVIILSPVLGALVLIVVPLFAAIYLTLRMRIQEASFAYQKAIGDVSAVAQESLSAYAVVKAFGLEDRVVAAFRGRLNALLKAVLHLIVIATMFETSIGLAVSMGQLVVLGVGGYLVIEGHVTIGTLLAFIGLLPSLFEPIGALSNLGQAVERAAGALDRVIEVLDEPRVIEDRPGAAPLAPLAREIRFDHVTFGYEPGRPILHDIDLVIPAGANVAIVGPSGSGKSSLVSLLLRFWDPDQGHLLFDGQDLRDVALTSLRDQIGLVFQDTFVFDTTVRENIAIGRPTATDAEVAAAAKAAQLDEYIASLPAGYDTVLGERGVRMSGGQRQRLAIARALLRDPRLLILDEATSALDSQTESEIQQTLNAAARGRTTISITHRLTSVTTAERIFVIDRGVLVEQGTHAELMTLGGLYQRLYQEQTRSGVDAAPASGIDLTQLREIPLFANLSDAALSTLAQRLVLERLEAGVDVVRQDDVGDKMYIIGSGQVEVLVAEGPDERRVNTLNTGEYFGEMALLMGTQRTATIRTTIPTELYSLAPPDFQRLLAREPAIREAIEKTVSNRRAALAIASSMEAVSAAAAPATSGH